MNRMDTGIQPSAVVRKTVLRVARRPALRVGRVRGGPATFPMRRPALLLTRAAVAGSAVVHAAVFAALLQLPGTGARIVRVSQESPFVVDLGRLVEPPPPPPDPPDPLPSPEPPVLPEPPPAPVPLPRVAAVTNPPPVEAVADAAPTEPAPPLVAALAEPAMPASARAEPAPAVLEEGAAWDLVRAAIHKHVAYPDSARRRGEEGRVVLVLTVADDGTVARLDATADGASQRLLAAALEAVRRAAPFARSSSGEFRIPIVFRLAPAPL